jgi:hypothetical protein
VEQVLTSHQSRSSAKLIARSFTTIYAIYSRNFYDIPEHTRKHFSAPY